MAGPVIFLDYHGPLNFKVVDSLLIKLKKTLEFKNLSTPNRKRTYSVFVESVENICKYSAFRESDDRKLQPRISIGLEDNRVVVRTGNPVPEEIRENLVMKLENVNRLNPAELRKMHEIRINTDPSIGDNGAGLGFICMAFKSGNDLSYSFNPLVPGYLYFELQITLNKFIMRKLLIDQTSNSPRVILDPEKKIYEISGESRPPDVREFYDQILSWMDDFSLQLMKTDNKTEPVHFAFNFGYFNSSSGKLILDICKILARLQAKGMNVKVNWHYEKDDVDMHEVGQEISRIVKFPFEYTETDPV